MKTLRLTILLILFFFVQNHIYSLTNGFGHGVNLQPSYYNNGNVNFGWSLMNQYSGIQTVRIEIEPDKVSQAVTWIREAKSNGKAVICTYHKSASGGSDATSELTNAANWWKANYNTLAAAGSFTINLMNEWGSHYMTSSVYASAYNSAISIVRQVYSGTIIIDCPGWAQETRIAANASSSISDGNIILSVHIYPDSWNQAKNSWLTTADLDELGNTGRPCIVGEFGSIGSGSTNWSLLVDHAKSKGWTILGWCWNGDGNSMNMVTPSWATNPTATSFSASSYMPVVINKIGGSSGGSCTPTSITPYLQINNGSWQQTSSASLAAGGTVKFGPQPTSGGSWSWSGPNGFNSTSREVTISNIQANQAGNYVSTYTNSCGSKSTKTFTVTVTGSTEGSTITVRARGVGGSEQMQIRLNGTIKGTWTLSTSYQNYSVTGTGTVQVYFTNDGSGRDIQVDYALINGTTYQSENQTTNTGFYTNGKCGGSYSEWLHCNGYIQFGTTAKSTDFELDALNGVQNEVNIYPNPLTKGELTVELLGMNGKSFIKISDLSGRIVHTTEVNGESKVYLSPKLLNGIYLVILENEGRVVINKLIVNNNLF